ncbi:phosphatase PAP2 family protein [Flavobacterium sp. CYK-4]|uniref:phosphatase PAP2 family protein n=1 Tax=Flavobacterium lotistagni TaxID=2709660 RepID=UPI00140E0F5D|nr:phosphatase PAP2 family protein [Flavobacterium lotistagni]NHM05785.1 phosphatase PAP2 family protein [Flavobacterium lotistagni]
MLEKIIAADKQLFVFLNGLGAETYDGLWLGITHQFYWMPFYLLVFYLLQKKVGLKNTLIVLLFVAALITVGDQTANLFKAFFQRLRPCNDPEIKDIIRIVKSSDTFSFFSGHATSSMATTVFVFQIFRKYYKFAFLLFVFPLFFAYSRIYLGMHFPLDILTGYTVGTTYAYLFHRLHLYLQPKYFPSL